MQTQSLLPFALHKVTTLIISPKTNRSHLNSKPKSPAKGCLPGIIGRFGIVINIPPSGCYPLLPLPLSPYRPPLFLFYVLPQVTLPSVLHARHNKWHATSISHAPLHALLTFRDTMTIDHSLKEVHRYSMFREV